MPDERTVSDNDERTDEERENEQPQGDSSAEAPDGTELDRRDLDDPQSPNHPMVPPHRVDAEGDNTGGRKLEGQKIHDDAIAAMKRGESVDLSEGNDQGDVSGTPSAGAGSNDDVKYEPESDAAVEAERGEKPDADDDEQTASERRDEINDAAESDADARAEQ